MTKDINSLIFDINFLDNEKSCMKEDCIFCLYSFMQNYFLGCIILYITPKEIYQGVTYNAAVKVSKS